MRKIVLYTVLASMVLISVSDAFAGPRASDRRREAAAARRPSAKATPAPTNSNICKKILSVQSRDFIYKNSAPLRSGGVGTPLIGYRNEPTLIMYKRFGSGGTTIYSKNYQKIGSCPWASAHGAAGGRFRCTMNTGGLRRSAVSKSRGSATILFTLPGKTCVSVPDAGRCYGSVKGRCNQLIK